MAMTVEQLTALKNERVRKTSEVDDPRYFGLHIGAGGSGKTSILGTLPGKVLIIDMEDGTLPLRDLDNTDVWICGRWEDCRQALMYVEAAEHDYDSIAIDGFARLQQYDIKAILAESGKRFMQKEMWGITLEHLSLMVTWLRALSVNKELHIAVSVLEKELKDEDAIVARIPDLQGSIKDKLAPMFDNVSYHMVKEHPPEGKEEHGELEFRVLTKPYGTRLLARDRFKVLAGVEALDLNRGQGISEWMDRITAAVTDGATPSGEASGASPTTPTATAKKGRKSKPKTAAQKAAAKAADTPPEPTSHSTTTASSSATPSSTNGPTESGPSSENPQSPSASSESSGDDQPTAEQLGSAIETVFTDLVHSAPHLEDPAYEVLHNAIAERKYSDIPAMVAEDDTDSLKATLAVITTYANKAKEVS